MRARRYTPLLVAVGLVTAALTPVAAHAEAPGSPAWRILVLVYPTTLVVKDGHTYVGTMDPGERDRSLANARRFVVEDIPRLTSGHMVPELALRVVARPLNLSSDGEGGWHPDPADAAPERDPAFDSVMVVWDQRTIDPALKPVTLHRYAGLTWPMGVGQTYSALPAEYAAHDDTNVFKHEFGHAVLFFHDALGIAPKPAVDNHGPPENYIHCGGGTPYVWEHEHDGKPIPNSIYNNDSGFTHDYMSGTVALAAEPDRCLGIPPEAWAAGGPVGQVISSKPAAAMPSTRTVTAIARHTSAHTWAMRTSSAPPSVPAEASISRRTRGASTSATTASTTPRPQKSRPGKEPIPSTATRFAAGEGGGPAIVAASG